MARKGFLGGDSDYGVSKASNAKPVRVVHISNPTMVKASVSEFRSVVQSLTGQKRSLAPETATGQSSSISSYASAALSADSDGSHALKMAKFEDASDILTACNSKELGDRDDSEHQRLEKHKVSAIEIHDILSQQMCEWPDGTGDNKFFGLELLSPSFFSSDFDNLYLNLLM